MKRSALYWITLASFGWTLACDGSAAPLGDPDGDTTQGDAAGPEADTDAAALDSGAALSDDTLSAGDDAQSDIAEPVPAADLYATEIVSFEPGPHAGFGAEDLPEVVLGPPGGAEGTNLEVLSLGVGGRIVLSFGDKAIVDGPGPDLIVFENPFWVSGDPTNVWAELGRVSVSEDGETWQSFACDTEPTEPGRWPGCAGWSVVHAYPVSLDPLDEDVTGGDPFDLADLGVTRARFVQIEDLSDSGSGQSAGFDLDALGLIHWEARPER